MVIHDLDIFGSSFAPSKANSQLVIDANTELAFSVPAQCLEAIAWRLTEIEKFNSRFKSTQGTFGGWLK